MGNQNGQVAPQGGGQVQNTPVQNQAAPANNVQPTAQPNVQPSANKKNAQAKNAKNVQASAQMKEKKLMFKYKIQDDRGKIKTGYLDAYSQAEVKSYLKNDGYKILSIDQQNAVLNMQIGGGKLKYAELSFLLTQLSTYLKAGIPLMESMKILERQSVKANKKRIYSNIIYELSKGETFSNALTAQGNVFPPLLINMVKTAELTGDLTEILDDMQEYYDSIDRTRKEAVSAMIYPSILFVFAIGILVFILTYVVPSFVTLFEQQNAQLPTVTKIVLGASKFLVSKKYWILGTIFVLVTSFLLLYKYVKGFKKTVQTITMKTPGFGQIIIYREVTMFTKTFASLLNHNVFITDSMEILRTVSDNEIFKEIINESLGYLSKGAKISDAFEDKWAFPIVAYEMLVTGENTGRLPMMMSYVADYYEDLHANLVKRINTFIEPILIILIAVIVGVVVVSVVMPMFDFYGTVL